MSNKLKILIYLHNVFSFSIKIEKFQLGKSSFTRYTDTSLRWIAENIDLDIGGQYKYEYSRFL